MDLIDQVTRIFVAVDAVLGMFALLQYLNWVTF